MGLTYRLLYVCEKQPQRLRRSYFSVHLTSLCPSKTNLFSKYGFSYECVTIQWLSIYLQAVYRFVVCGLIRLPLVVASPTSHVKLILLESVLQMAVKTAPNAW